MLVPVKWIKDYVDVNMTPEEFGNLMTDIGLTLEVFEEFGKEMEKVVIGRIDKIEQHPNADKLVVCQVNVGGEEDIQIVTGATNVYEGAFVPVVLDGGRVPGPLHGKEKEEGGTVITAGELRGVFSNGMMCGPQELGWADKVAPIISKDGIWLLPGTDWTPGADLAHALELDTYVVDLDVTPNRSDWLSILAVAKETKAATGLDIKLPSTSFKEGSPAPKQASIRFQPKPDPKINTMLKVDVEDPNCLRYTARVIKKVKIEQSPWWMQQRLMLAGMRPINNIVDITNFVMLELGQPLHAFDINTVADGHIIVAPSKAGDTFVTLDGKERVLPEGTMMINDAEKAIGIAGIMGGLNSEITDDTETIILEAACFSSDKIGKSQKELAMRTEASSRYFRGVDPNLAEVASKRFCALVERLGAGIIVPGSIDIYPEKFEMNSSKVRVSRMNKVIGIDLSKEEMVKILEALDIKVEDIDEDTVLCTPPTIRLDLKEEIDYAEEIAREYGFDNIPMTLPKMNTQSIVSDSWKMRDLTKRIMTGLGANEIMTYSFVSPKSVDILRLPEDTWEHYFLEIRNPLGEDTSVMRTVLMPEMVEVMARNYNRSIPKACAFEIGNTFSPNLYDSEALPDENLAMSIGAYGEGEDFFTMKGRIEALFDALGIMGYYFEKETEYGLFHPGRCARILMAAPGEPIELGIMGEVHPESAEKAGIGTRLYVAELNFEALIKYANTEILYAPLPKFPAITRDIALTVDEEVQVGDIENVIYGANEDLLEDAKLFDIYRGPQVGEGKKSIAFKLTYRDASKTLTDEEVGKAHGNILVQLKEKCEAVLREM